MWQLHNIEYSLEEIQDTAVYILEQQDSLDAERNCCIDNVAGLENRLKSNDNTKYDIVQLQNRLIEQENVLSDIDSKIRFLREKYLELFKIRQDIECETSKTRSYSLMNKLDIPGSKKREYERLIKEVRIDLGLD